MKKNFLIQEQETGLYWNNENGFGDKGSATTFSKEDTEVLSLPIGGIWTGITPVNEGQQPAPESVNWFMKQSVEERCRLSDKYYPEYTEDNLDLNDDEIEAIYKAEGKPVQGTDEQIQHNFILYNRELFQMVKDLKDCINRLSQDNLSQLERDNEAQWEGEAHELLTRINPNYYKNANE